VQLSSSSRPWEPSIFPRPSVRAAGLPKDAILLIQPAYPAVGCASVADLTEADAAVLRLLDWLPTDLEVDAELVAALLRIPEAEALRLLEDLERAGNLTSACGKLQ
jgi:hypothetical protein